MARLLRLAFVAGVCSLAGCGGAPAAGATLRSAPESAEPRTTTGADETAPEPAREPAPVDAVEPVAFIEPTEGCKVELPRGRSGGVMTVAALDQIMASAEGPLSVALCGCLRPNASADVRVTVSPELGSVEATTGSANVDACLARALADRRFVAWELGSDCIGCGPARVTWFPHLAVTPAPPPPSRVVFPVRFAR